MAHSLKALRYRVASALQPDDVGVTLATAEQGLKAEAAIAPTRRVPARPRPTWVSTFQAGHGWTNPIGGGTLTDDTTNFILGTRSLRVTDAAAQRTGLALNLTDRTITLRLRINSIASGAHVAVYAAETTAFAAYKTWYVRSGTDASPWFPNGEWVTVTLPWESSTATVGAPNRASIDVLRVRAFNGAADFNVQAIGHSARGTQTGRVSFTFDDGYTSFLDAANILGQRGIAGTAFVIPTLAGTAGFLTAAQIRTLQDTYGWDIQSHGESVYTGLTEAQMRTEWTATRAWFAANGLGRGEHLAYVGGQNNTSVVSVAREYFATARTIANGPQLETIPPAQRYRLRAMSSITSAAGGNSVATVQTAIDRAVSSGQWAILVFHRIVAGTAASTMECSQADLATIADYAVASGADITTLADAAA